MQAIKAWTQLNIALIIGPATFGPSLSECVWDLLFRAVGRDLVIDIVHRQLIYAAFARARSSFAESGGGIGCVFEIILHTEDDDGWLAIPLDDNRLTLAHSFIE